MSKEIIKERLWDLFFSVLAGITVAFGLHVFSSANGFAPGGINGIASVLGEVTGVSMGYFMIALNLPLFIMTSIFVEKKLGFYLTIYVATQSISLILFKQFGFWRYEANEGTMIFATVATGVVTGFGFATQIRRHGASGGTYAISALIKHWRPAANLAWVSFMLDSSVVFLVFIRNLVIQLSNGVAINVALNMAIVPSLCTLMNLFIANIVVDYCLQGAKEGYKFEIITEEPDSVSEEIMATLKHGVTELRVNGMYTHQQKYMIVCIIRKRELSKMMKILRKYPKSFSSFSRVNEVFGKFKK